MQANRPKKSTTAVILTLISGWIVGMTAVSVAGATTTAITKDESPDLALSQASAAESTLTFPPGTETVVAATVTVAATHTRVGDLVVRLTHVASGTTATLLDQAGVVGVGNGDNSNLLSTHPISFQDDPDLRDPETMGAGDGMGNNAVVCRDDGACTYRSHETLEAFTGLPASGDWRLSIADGRVQDNGLLDAWTLQLETEPEVTTTAPGAPTSTSAVAGDGAATLSWTAPASDGGTDITGYVVTPYVGPDALAPVVFGSPATTQTLTGLVNGTSYSFDVAAVNAVGTGPASTVSNTVVPLSVPGAPTSTSAVAGDGAATVSWTPPASDGGTDITGYVVTPYVGPDALAPVVFGSPATTQTLTGLVNGTSYSFDVAAVNAVGTGPASTVSNTVVPTLLFVPGAPTIGSAVAGDGAATVSWTAPVSDGGSAILGYVVTPYIGFVSQGPRYFVSTATTQTITGLTNGTTYRFKVRAWNAVGVSDFSGTSNAATPVASTVPGAPTIGVAVAGVGQATVSWSAPATDGGSPIIGYVVTPYIGFVSQGPRYFISTSTTQTITGLTSGTTYRFQVRAWNAVGVSPFSGTSNAVTPSA